MSAKKILFYQVSYHLIEIPEAFKSPSIFGLLPLNLTYWSIKSKLPPISRICRLKSLDDLDPIPPLSLTNS